jgi:hypothetical protein
MQIGFAKIICIEISHNRIEENYTENEKNNQPKGEIVVFWFLGFLIPN